jgi:aspartyl-tRNA(Asn)/glutamyl-tRNA(Gln) amidotransferase subunit A
VVAQNTSPAERNIDTCEARVSRYLTAIAAADGEGSRIFTQVYAASALLAATDAEHRRVQGSALSSVDGLVVAIKDLFDVQGQATWAGSVALRNAPVAATDAPAVARLRRAGAVIIGKTNMTEFAYSGIGLNPHFGTPANPFGRGTLRRVPGGSSSGAAVAIADGMADIALGTDTGGSVRIPAALCGLVGWKPSARRISLEGVWPLAPSFDSVGVIARSVRLCAEADAVLTDTPPNPQIPLKHLRLGRLRGYLETELEAPVSYAYQCAIERLKDAGVEIIEVSVAGLERVLSEQPGVIMTTYEAFRTHSALLGPLGSQYDPRVRSRLELGRNIAREQYDTAAAFRRQLQQEAQRVLQDFDAWLVPTVTKVAPPFTAVEADADYLAVNRALLRNTSLLNFLDGCAMTLPCQPDGTPPVGLSIAGLGVRDLRVLAAAQACEAIVAGTVDSA